MLCTSILLSDILTVDDMISQQCLQKRRAQPHSPNKSLCFSPHFLIYPITVYRFFCCFQPVLQQGYLLSFQRTFALGQTTVTALHLLFLLTNDLHNFVLINYAYKQAQLFSIRLITRYTNSKMIQEGVQNKGMACKDVIRKSFNFCQRKQKQNWDRCSD